MSSDILMRMPKSRTTVYEYLLQHAENGLVRISAPHLARRVKLEESTVRVSIKDLIDAKLVSVYSNGKPKVYQVEGLA